MKTRTKIIITISGIAGIIVILTLAYLGVFAWQTRIMLPLETGEAGDNVVAVRDGFVNMFIVKGSSGYIAIDAGMNAKNVAKELATLKIDPQQVKALFLTHSDSDHTGAVGLFPNAALYLPKNEEQMINGQTPRFVIFGNRLENPYTLLESGTVLNAAGLIVQSIATPGHTPGSMSYLVNNRLLFVGDTMSLHDGKVDLFNDFFNMDSDRQRESITFLRKFTNIDAVFTAHYGTTHDYQDAFAGWR